MKFAIRPGLMALSIGTISPAFAGDNPNMSPVVIAEAPAQNAPVATTLRGQEIRTNTHVSGPPTLKYAQALIATPRAAAFSTTIKLATDPSTMKFRGYEEHGRRRGRALETPGDAEARDRHHET